MKKSDRPRRYAVCRSFIVLKNVVWKSCPKNFLKVFCYTLLEGSIFCLVPNQRQHSTQYRPSNRCRLICSTCPQCLQPPYFWRFHDVLYTESEEAGRAIVAVCGLMDDPGKAIKLGEYRRFPMKRLSFTDKKSQKIFLKGMIIYLT